MGVQTIMAVVALVLSTVPAMASWEKAAPAPTPYPRYEQEIEPIYGENYTLRRPEPERREWNGIVDRHVFKDANDYLNDEQVLIANIPTKPESTVISYQLPQSTLERLDAQLKAVTYDPAAKIISQSRSPEEVLAQKRGNCFEVARLAMLALTREGYKTHMIDVKTSNSTEWHSICAFQELDGTWSYFSATKKHVGYTPVHAKSIDDLVRSFKNFSEMKVLS